MKKKACWVLNIPARSFNSRSARAGGAGTSVLAAATLLVSAGIAWPAPPSRQGLADLAQGLRAYSNGDWASAVENLERSKTSVPQLSDYTTYHLASAYMSLNQPLRAIAALGDLKQFSSPVSLFASKATLLAARSSLAATGTDTAVPAPAAQFEFLNALRERYSALPQPETDLALATSADAAGQRAQAAVLYQRVYFFYPATEAAARAAEALERLRTSMGADYPPPMPDQMLARVEKWVVAREYGKARAELDKLLPQLGGTERDQARVRSGVIDYVQGNYGGAYQYLKNLALPRSEADAERLYYLAECARRMNDDAELTDALKTLARHYEKSPWRLKTLVTAGNRFLLEHRTNDYTPLYRAAYEKFAPDTTTAYCHWKVTWDAYLHRDRAARELLRDQVSSYPFDARAATAMYFLGRLAENDRDWASARAWYERLSSLFPNYYYGMQARERLRESPIVAAASSPKVNEWLASVAFPPRKNLSVQDPTPVTAQRIERARLLRDAGLPDLAEAELRFGARTDAQPYLLAIELTRSSPSAFQSLRVMKSLVPDYLNMPFEAAPRRFWELLFPLPWHSDLVSSARRQNLDPYIIAGLIRQESEFNPGAVSHANAWGLTQIVPSTGRQLARQNGIRGFRTSMLLQPSTNMRLGATYIRTLLDGWGGKWEQTLASYNGGKSRVSEWLTWNDYAEPAEFVESIPFTETREYVQAVLRNAAVYRTLYGSGAVAAQDEEDDDRPPAMIRAAVTKPGRNIAVLKTRVGAKRRHSVTTTKNHVSLKASKKRKTPVKVSAAKSKTHKKSGTALRTSEKTSKHKARA